MKAVNINSALVLGRDMTFFFSSWDMGFFIFL